MPSNMTDENKEKIISEIENQGEVVKSYNKLNRKAASLKVPRRMSYIKDLQTMLSTIAESDTPEDKKSEQKAEIDRELEKSNNDVIEATLVPLTAIEMLTVQGFVAEASTRGTESGFDLDVRLFMIVKSEHCALVYLATRQKKNPAKRYFSGQDDVVMMDDETLHEIARQYKEAFILTPDERKNS